MKIGGREAKPKGELPPIVFARYPVQDSIVFKIKPLEDYTQFNDLVPRPKPGKMRTAQGIVDDLEAPGYQESLDKFWERRGEFMLIKTLEPSDIEWENVKLDDPATWKNCMTELASILDDQELTMLVTRIHKANLLDERAMEEAADAFFRSQLPSA